MLFHILELENGVVYLTVGGMVAETVASVVKIVALALRVPGQTYIFAL